MNIFKFGGASVKDADGVRNLKHIIETYQNDKLLIVLSAMGKTTNRLEEILNAFYYEEPQLHTLYQALKQYHYQIIADLFETDQQSILDEINNTFVEIDWLLEEGPLD